MPSTCVLEKPAAGGPAWYKPALKLVAGASLALLLALATATLQAAPAAAPITVNDTADQPGLPPLNSGHCVAPDGKCTLRAAIMAANHSSGGATIILPAGTYSLTIPASGPDDETAGDLNISTTVGIHGAGASSTIIDANAGTTLDRAFSVGAGAALSLSGVTIRGGAPSANGGGIYNAGVVSLDSSAVISNVAGSPGGDGGGLYSIGQALTVTNSLISGNTAQTGGGGIDAVVGSVTIVNSTIRGNLAAINGGGISGPSLAVLSVYSSTIGNNTAYNGGGIFEETGNTLLVATTVSSNTATPGAGGGLVQEGGLATLINSTISGNNADTDGGGIWNSCPCGSVVHLYNVTIANNQADAQLFGSGTGGGVFNDNNVINAVELTNTLVAGNRASQLFFHKVYIAFPNDCHGALMSGDYNLIGTTNDCTFTASSHDQLNVSAGLNSLQANGGPTLTQALLLGSLAIDAGTPTGCLDQTSTLLTTDQRGRPRTANGAGTTRCDIGAFELQRIVDLPLVRH